MPGKKENYPDEKRKDDALFRGGRESITRTKKVFIRKGGCRKKKAE